MKYFLFVLLSFALISFTGCSKEKSNPIDPGEDDNDEDIYFWIPQGVPSGVNSAAVDPSLNIWAGTGEGVYVRSAGSSVWEKRNTGLTNMINSTLIKSSESGDIYSIFGTSLYFYNPLSKKWINISGNLNNTLRTFDHMYTFSVDKNNILYAGMFISEKSDPSSIAVDGPAFFKSSDKGVTWERITVTQWEGQVRDISFDHNGRIFIIMDANVYISSDNGATWAPSLNGILGTNPFMISGDSEDNLYCATGSGLYQSTDAGSTWSNANWTTYCLSVGINKTDKIIVGAINRCWFTADEGVNWIEISSGLSYSLAGFSDALIQTVDKEGYVYCILEGVLYKSVVSTEQ